jgi:hypothetical protein
MVRSCSSTQPLSQWVKGPPQNGVCRTCTLTSLAVAYEQTLRSSGQKSAADGFLSFLEGDGITPASVAKRMDQIKAQVPTEVSAKLRGLDCEAQST